MEYSYFIPWLGDCAFTTNGMICKAKRKEIQQFFNLKTIENSVNIMEKHADNFVHSLSQQKSGVAFNVCHAVDYYAMDVICETALGLENNSHEKPTEYQHHIEEYVSKFEIKYF